MEYYTKKQALAMIVNGVGAASNYAKEVSVEMSTEMIKTVAHGAMIDPSTLDVKKQIEAVRGLIVFHGVIGRLSEEPKCEKDELKRMHVILTKHLKALTETLQPHLNGEKLEV